jgi:fatty-acyl-CoA synthase
VPEAPAGIAATGCHATYEDVLSQRAPGFDWHMPTDGWECLALSYTSGTTGRPKGVVYHHRSAYLMKMGTVISWRMVLYPMFMQFGPLFHCIG